MKVLHIIGADLSKDTIDFANQQKQHLQVNNNREGFKELLKWLRQQKINSSQAMIVMEHTGFYSYSLEQFLFKARISFAKVSALAIKRSLGLIRGKNDKIDAIRIARYGFEKQDQLQPCMPVGKANEQLKLLYSGRNGLVRHRTSMINAMKAFKQTGISLTNVLIQGYMKMIRELDRQIQRLEDEIAAVIDADRQLKCNYGLLQSAKGVGPIVALAMIVKTGNFTRFNDGRKFACYCGTAPFEHSSGISVRGKTKVSHLADKDMKGKLHQAAKNAIQWDQEIKEFYQRRIASGKSKMATLNIVSNKMINRMFAIIKRQTPYVDNYLASA